MNEKRRLQMDQSTLQGDDHRLGAIGHILEHVLSSPSGMRKARVRVTGGGKKLRPATRARIPLGGTLAGMRQLQFVARFSF